MSDRTQVRSVPELDLARYTGTWFEIGRLPLKWEDPAASRITATYTIADNGKVTVDNRCYDENGEPTRTLGEATPVDGEPGQLEVSFLPAGLRWLPFTKGDYWVLKIDPDYSVALVGTPDHENLWLLAREHRIDPAVKEQYLDHARAQGFDLTAWITPHQDGMMVSPERVED